VTATPSVQPGGPARIEPWQLSARLLIREAVEKNFYHYDHDEMAEAYSTFTEDGILEYPSGQDTYRGRAQILSRFSARPEGRTAAYGYIRHNLTNHYLTRLMPTQASAVSYYLVHCDGQIVTGGVFYDEFVAQEEQWRVRHRRIRQDFVNLRRPGPVTPAAQGDHHG
jgi:hypothetical protein